MLRSPGDPSTDELRVYHMIKLDRLLREELDWLRSCHNIKDYIIHISVIDDNLSNHLRNMERLREDFVYIMAHQSQDHQGRDIYGEELRNIRVRHFFQRIARLFTSNQQCRKYNPADV